ncbi:MAG: flagellar basal body-associated FliL family protein [Pseudomonadota bacterium]
MAANQNSAPDDENEDKSGPGVILIAAGAFIAAAIAGAGSYFLTPQTTMTPDGKDIIASINTLDTDGKSEAKNQNDKKKEAKKKTAKKKDKRKSGDGKSLGGELKFVGDAAFFLLDPLVISIRPIGRSRHLKITLVIETTPETAETLSGRAVHIKDAMNTYLRSVDVSAFEDPAAMSRLRAQIQRRARIVAPNTDIKSVLITEFILT